MLDWVRQLSAYVVFLSVAGVGFVFLLISLVFGELFEIFDHDGGDAGHDADGDHGGPGFFSTRVLSVFVMAFGGFGAIATQYGLSPMPASAVGFAGGVVLGGVVYGFGRFLWSQQSATEVRTTDLVGQSARVTVAIPAGGLGQVRCRIGEQLVDKIARAADGRAIPENAVVHIQEVLGETVIVKPQE
jgi:membrane protein implicated in regulation of membrane protease activity